jgi:hypothetical protein
MDTNVHVTPEAEARLLASPTHDMLELDPTSDLNVTIDEPNTPMSDSATQSPQAASLLSRALE